MRLQVRREGATPPKLFTDPRRRPGHRVNRCSCTLRDFSPTESHAKSLEVLERKGNSSPGRRGRRLGGWRVAPCSRTSAPSAWRTVEPPSLWGRRSRRPSRSAFGGALRRRFTHVQMLFTWNLAPPRSSCISPEYLLLPPRSAPDRAAARARARPSALGPRPLTRPPLRRSGEHRTRRFSAIHFRGPLIRQVSCYTLLSGFRLPWPPSCCHHQRAPFRYLG